MKELERLHRWRIREFGEHAISDIHKDVLKKYKETQRLIMINTLVEFSKAHFDIHTEEAVSYITDKAESYYNETFKSE
jgi:hypothetical protein